MARIVLNETSYHGAGCIAEIATEAKNRGFAHAFVCSDPDLVKFGVTGKVFARINMFDRETTLEIDASQVMRID